MNPEQALLEQLLAEAGIDGSSAGPAPRVGARNGRCPLSFAQELLWSLDNASPGLSAYNVPLARRIAGELDVSALARSLTAVAARHDILRTRFTLVDGEPAQIVDPLQPVAIERIDLCAEPAAARAALADSALAARARQPFELAHEHMFRAALVRLAPDDHIFLLALHHIVCDGASIGILARELSAYYRAFRAGASIELPALDFQYADYALWQRETLAGEKLRALLAYWRTQLGERSEPLELPTDRPRPATPQFAGTQRSLVLEPGLVRALEAIARAHDATLYMLVLALYAVLLHRYTGRRDVLVGSNVAGRMESGTERLIGYFNNTLAMRADFSGDPSFSELLARVRESCFGAYDHQEVPFEKLVLELRAGEERLTHAPLFDVVFSAQNNAGAAFAFEGTSVEPYGVDLGTTKFDLSLFMAETAQGLRLTLRARSDLWNASSVERMLGELQRLAESVRAQPDQRIALLPLLTRDEERLIGAANATAVDTSEGGVLDDFAVRARGVPEAIAVRCGDETVTYAELQTRADALARRLRTCGVERGTPVGLGAERSLHTVTGILGILRAGAAYVPLEPGIPHERLRQQLAESAVQFVVARRAASTGFGLATSTVVFLDDDASATASRRDTAAADAGTSESGVTLPTVRRDDLAYVLFTSGSTGVPKGVAVSHGNLASYVRAISRVLAEDSADTPGGGVAELAGMQFAMTGTFAADLGHTMLFPALCSGATLHVLPAEVTTDAARFAAYLAARRIDVAKITPSHLRALTSGVALGDALPRRSIVLGGEALGLDFAQAVIAARKCRVLNHYGPTETTVGATTFEVTAHSLASAREAGARTVPIGRPLPGVAAHVLDANLQMVPLGVPGELYVAGSGVARGYYNRPEFTAERFIDLPGVGRAYRTGDRVRRLPSGALEFLGRTDAQVKVRGYRVDPGDIEHALAQHPAVRECAVVLCGAVDDCARAAADAPEPALIAYVAPALVTTDAEIRAWLSERVPEYMLPATVVMLETLPLTANGKLDRRALPDPRARAEADAYVAPRTPTEAALAAIWSEVLKRERIGMRERFLELGGHSLLAIRILGKLSRTFGIRLPLRALFEAPTIEQLALAVNDAVDSSDPDDLGPMPRGSAATLTQAGA